MAEALSKLRSENAVPEPKARPEQLGQDDIEVLYLKRIYDEGKKNQRPRLKKWKINEKYYQGDQFLVSKNKPSLNIIHQTIQWQLSQLTDINPTFRVLPADPSDYAFSKMLSSLVESWWDNNEITQNITQAVFDSLKYDAAILKVGWNAEINEGAGDIEITNVSPKDIFVSPGTVDFDKTCPYVLHKMTKSVGNLKRRYPKKAANIRPDFIKDVPSQDDMKEVEPYDQDYRLNNKNNHIKSDDRNLCEVLECWTKDNSLEEFIEEQADGTNKTTVKKKYPLGKVTTWLPNQNVILDEKPNEYLHGQFPFIRMINNVGLDPFWGDGELIHLIPIQKQINNVIGNITANLNLMGNPLNVTENNNGITDRMINNRRAGIVRTKEGKINTFRRESGVPLPNYFFNFFQMLLNAADRTTGSSEISQGRRSEGDPQSGVGINLLQESSHQRIRAKERLHNLALNQLGRMVIQLMLQYYNTPRMVTITNTDQGMPDFVEFYFDDYEDGKSIKKKQVKYNADTDEYEYGEWEEQPIKKSIFDIKISTQVSSQIMKAQRLRELKYMLESKLITPEMYIKATDLPEKAEILKEMELMRTQGQPIE